MNRVRGDRLISLILSIVVCMGLSMFLPMMEQTVCADAPSDPLPLVFAEQAKPVVVFDKWEVEDSDHINAVISLSRFNTGDNVTLALIFFDTELSFSCSSGLTLIQYDELNNKALFYVSGANGGPNGKYSFTITGTNIDARVPKLLGAIPSTPADPTATPTPTPTNTPIPKETNTPTPVPANTSTPIPMNTPTPAVTNAPVSNPSNTTVPMETTASATTIVAPIETTVSETTTVETTAVTNETTTAIVPSTEIAATTATDLTEAVPSEEVAVIEKSTEEPAEQTTVPSEIGLVLPKDSEQNEMEDETQPPSESETNVAQSIVASGTTKPKRATEEKSDYTRLIWGSIVFLLAVIAYIRYRKLEKEDKGFRYILVNFIPIQSVLEKFQGKQAADSVQTSSAAVKNGYLQKPTPIASAAATYRPIKSNVSETTIQRKINEKKTSEIVEKKPSVNTQENDILPEMMKSQEALERSMEELAKEMEQLKNFKE